MFCPKCGAENTEEASFCRGCGANISLVPQALTGLLAAPLSATAGVKLSRDERRAMERERKREREERERARRREREGKKPPSVESAVVPFFSGIGFLLVAVAIMLFVPFGYRWGFWLFIPGFSMLGAGVAGYMRLKEMQRTTQLPGYVSPLSIPAPTQRAAELPTRRDTAEFYPPGSVTEGTTKLLDQDQ